MRFNNNISVGRRCEIRRHFEQYTRKKSYRVETMKEASWRRDVSSVVVCHTLASTIVFAAASSRRVLWFVPAYAKWFDGSRCRVSGHLDFVDFTARSQAPSSPNPQTVQQIRRTALIAWKPARLESTKWTDLRGRKVTGLRVRLQTTAYRAKVKWSGVVLIVDRINLFMIV